MAAFLPWRLGRGGCRGKLNKIGPSNRDEKSASGPRRGRDAEKAQEAGRREADRGREADARAGTGSPGGGHRPQVQREATLQANTDTLHSRPTLRLP